MPTNTAKKPDPPAAAVAQDSHWAQSLERLRNRQRPTATLTICDDQDLKDRLAYAKQIERRAQTQADTNPDSADATALLAEAQTKLAEAQAAYDQEVIVLRFQALKRADFETLKAAHPPTEEQADEGESVNVETLAPVLISAASLDGITVEQAAEFLEEWAASEAAELFHTAWDIQLHSRQDLGKG